MASRRRIARHWLKWCRYLDHYQYPDVIAGNNAATTAYNWWAASLRTRSWGRKHPRPKRVPLYVTKAQRAHYCTDDCDIHD